jgi:hypothetical protein
LASYEHQPLSPPQHRVEAKLYPFSAQHSQQLHNTIFQVARLQECCMD